MENVYLLLIVICLVFYFCYYNKEHFDSENTANNFADFTNYHQPVEMEHQRSRYNSVSAWDDFHEKVLTIVGGDSLRKFIPGRKFRMTSVKRERNGNLTNGNRTNMPFIYIETSRDGNKWDLHREYSAPADTISFEGYNTFTISAPGGNLRFIRYPNGRLWIGNEGGDGDLHTIELTSINLKAINDEIHDGEDDIDFKYAVHEEKMKEYTIENQQKNREPGLNSRYDPSDAEDTPSALHSSNSVL